MGWGIGAGRQEFVKRSGEIFAAGGRGSDPSGNPGAGRAADAGPALAGAGPVLSAQARPSTVTDRRLVSLSLPQSSCV
jgi:hypothetical protein